MSESTELDVPQWGDFRGDRGEMTSPEVSLAEFVELGVLVREYIRLHPHTKVVLKQTLNRRTLRGRITARWEPISS